jgi:hypothetical protein
MFGNSLLAERLSGSEGGLSPMELVSLRTKDVEMDWTCNKPTDTENKK